MNERKGTASAMAKAVIGPMIDKLIADGVLPKADYAINAGIHDEAIIERADPGDDEDADEDEDDEDERASDAAASRRAVGYDDVVDCLNEAIGMVRRTADPAKLMAEREHFDMLCATARRTSASGAGDVLMDQEVRAAGVVRQLQKWIDGISGKVCDFDDYNTPAVELRVTHTTCDISIDDELVWCADNGYAEDVDAPDDEHQPTFERCRAAFQRRCERLAAFVAPLYQIEVGDNGKMSKPAMVQPKPKTLFVMGEASVLPEEACKDAHKWVARTIYINGTPVDGKDAAAWEKAVKPSCGVGKHARPADADPGCYTACTACGMTVEEVAAEGDAVVYGEPRMASVASQSKGVRTITTDEASNAVAKLALEQLTAEGSDRKNYDSAAAWAEDPYVDEELREQLRGAMYDWRTSRGIV